VKITAIKSAGGVSKGFKVKGGVSGGGLILEKVRDQWGSLLLEDRSVAQ